MRAALHALLAGFAAALIAFCTLTGSAQAHQTASSTLHGEVRPDEREVDLLLSISPQDLALHLRATPNESGLLDRDQLERLEPRMAEYLSSNLAVDNDGRACEPRREAFVDSERAGGALVFRYTAECTEELGEVDIANRVMLETTGGYTHYGRIQLGDDVHTTIFDRSTPVYSVEVADGGGALAAPDLVEVVGQYLWEGVLHILIGLDHVLFVLLLLVAARDFHRLLWVITSFTVAHSITLVLSALEVVSLSPELVEPLIAASIAWLAIETLLDRKPGRHLFAVTFGFGLLHGFGFAYVLRDNVGLPTETLLPALFSFNVGVELGQIAIVCVAFPLVTWARGKKWGEAVLKVLAAGVLAVSLYWLVTRVGLL